MRRRNLITATTALLAFVAVSALSCGIVSCGGGPQRPDGGSGLLDKGAPAPALSGLDQDGKTRRVADEKGSFLVVYFYPKDGTPGCTAEACAFRDVWDRYEEAGVAVYGVSADDVQSHKKFADEHALEFPLIADTDGVWASAFGVGTFLGYMQRVTFLIDPAGLIAATYPDVDPGVHASDVLRDVAKLEQ